MLAITLDGKRGHEFEGEQGRIFRRDWREKGEERDTVIKIQAQK